MAKTLDNTNLKQALHNKYYLEHTSIPKMATAIGISKGTLESYFYGDKFPRKDILEKIANYLEIDSKELLPSPEEPVQNRIMEKDNDERHNIFVPSYNELISQFLVDKEYPHHASFLRLLELSGFSYRYIPALEEELNTMSVQIRKNEEKEIKQQEATFVPKQGSSLGKYAGNTDMQAALDILKSILNSDPVNSVENDAMLELFVNQINDKLYQDTEVEDLPLSIQIMKSKRFISPEKYDDSTLFKDVLQVPCKTMPIADFLDLEIDLIKQLEKSLIIALKNL